MPEENSSVDIFGIRPLAKAVEKATEASIDGAKAFLGRICLPAAEEFGYLLQDKVKAWRAKNALEIAEKAEVVFQSLPNRTGISAHPRVVGAIFEHGSWADEADVQDMWAGLLATACSKDGKDQGNLIYADLLAKMTTSQVRVLDFACKEATKFKSETGLLLVNDFYVKTEALMEAGGYTDIHALDLEVDYLRQLGLVDLQSMLSIQSLALTRFTPSLIALQLFVRCQGYVGSPTDLAPEKRTA